MPTEKVTKAVVCPLETSNRKNERLQRLIDEWQEVAEFYANRLASFEEYKWGNHTNDGTGVFYKPIKEGEFDHLSLYSSDMQAAIAKVSEAYSSWQANGKQGAHPKGQFGDGDYMRMKKKSIEIVENDRGFGIEAKMEPYEDNEWFHIHGGEYQYEILDAVVNGDMEHGTAEFHLDPETGALHLHLSVTDEVELPDPQNVDTVVGVDVGENKPYVAVAMSDGKVTDQRFGSEDGYRHRRRRIREAKDGHKEKGHLGLITGSELEQRLTKQFLDTKSREVVDFAIEHYPSLIVLEDLTGLREQVGNHDWAYSELQAKIIYKAKESGIPVEKVKAFNTSITCRKCGYKDGDNRDGNEFCCLECGNEVHADFNAAINIAKSV